MAFPFAFTALVLFLAFERESFLTEFSSFRVPVIYLSNILPLAILFLDFGVNGLRVNYKLLLLNLFFVVVYFVIAFLGEVAMSEPIFLKFKGSDIFPLKFYGFNDKK